ncbi:hypothetical protein MNBD_GAMMA05-88 [hydrothermal vent metagenome]|uniref:HTH arsR-type domain-containing protein n=1 Tax=hydrothermal vent metagenome TaxID=652676 RepID=A0A3B0WKF1_9ZZZZ
MKSLGDALFTKTQQKVLGLLFNQPKMSFYTTEIMQLVNMGRGTVSRELDRLVATGVLKVSKKGNQIHYQADLNCPIYSELKSIVQKLSDFEDKYKRTSAQGISQTALKKLIKTYRINRLSLFGSAARGELSEDSDIDLLIEFENGQAPSLGEMIKLKDKFSRLFNGRNVDIATPTILNNPYRRKAIEKDMEVLYAA